MHAKAYIFVPPADAIDGRAGVIAGSSNLTGGGLNRNLELNRPNYGCRNFLILSCGEEVSSPCSRSTAPAFCHLRIDSLPHSAPHIGGAQSGMVLWGFVITIKRRVAIARTLSVLFHIGPVV